MWIERSKLVICTAVILFLYKFSSIKHFFYISSFYISSAERMNCNRSRSSSRISWRCDGVACWIWTTTFDFKHFIWDCTPDDRPKIQTIYLLKKFQSVKRFIWFLTLVSQSVVLSLVEARLIELSALEAKPESATFVLLAFENMKRSTIKRSSQETSWRFKRK